MIIYNQYQKIKPIRSQPYLAFIRTVPCVACHQVSDAEPHHVQLDGGIIGGKCSDLWTIPLCREHHDEIADITLKLFERKYDLDIPVIILRLNAYFFSQMFFIKKKTKHSDLCFCNDCLPQGDGEI